VFRLFAAAVVLGGILCLGRPVRADTGERVLILYDGAGPSGWIGVLHGKMLGNLLGHFELPHDLLAVEDYPASLLTHYQATFYLGTVFDHPLPSAFLTDAGASDRPLCWFLYNLWQLDAVLPEGLTNRFGFRFEFIDSSGFSEVDYRGEAFAKDQRDPDLGRTSVTDTHRAMVPAMARNPLSSEAIPYVVRSGRFWYVADSPFSFLTEEDRYVIFTDLLHDILERPHAESHAALIRLEDVAPNDNPQRLRQAVDVLAGESVPFTVAVIPVLEDPLGVYSDGEPRRVPLRAAPGMIEALRYALTHGGQLLLHGYTHQYKDVLNPLSGLSGDDYEFFRVQTDAEGEVTTFEPVPEDSASWVEDRIDRANTEFAAGGLSAVGWVTPHYTASPLDFGIFAARFERSMERGLYFDEEGHWASQFFPYPIGGDAYGQNVFPENLGHVGFEPGGRTVEDMLRTARKTRVVRDGWAGGFFHPFLDLEQLRMLVRGLKDLGYTFVPLTTNAPPSLCGQPPHLHRSAGSEVRLDVSICGAEPYALQWYHDGVPVPGATGTELVLPSLTPDQEGHYMVQVTNAYGSITSRPIPVRILSEPVITSFAISNGQFQVGFWGDTGLFYFVDYQDHLPAPMWTATFPVIGSGSMTNIPAPLGGLGRRFYRLRVE